MKKVLPDIMTLREMRTLKDLLQENIGTLMRKERIIVPWNKFRSGAKFSVLRLPV
jgi:hypothetical protein